MPADLLKPLNGEEVLDLLAYLLSRGNPDDPVFAAAAKPTTAGGAAASASGASASES